MAILEVKSPIVTKQTGWKNWVLFRASKEHPGPIKANPT
jgi:hypothetical protein